MAKERAYSKQELFEKVLPAIAKSLDGFSELIDFHLHRTDELICLCDERKAYQHFAIASAVLSLSPVII